MKIVKSVKYTGLILPFFFSCKTRQVHELSFGGSFGNPEKRTISNVNCNADSYSENAVISRTSAFSTDSVNKSELQPASSNISHSFPAQKIKLKSQIRPAVSTGVDYKQPVQKNGKGKIQKFFTVLGVFLILFGLASFFFANPFLSIFILITGGVCFAAGMTDNNGTIAIMAGFLIPILLVVLLFKLLSL